MTLTRRDISQLIEPLLRNMKEVKQRLYEAIENEF